MTSGTRVRRRACLAAPGLLLFGRPAFAFTLHELMAQLSQRKSGEARFTEQRWIGGIDQPQAAAGRLTFTAPDRFARYTVEPRAESMEVVGNSVTLERRGRRRQLTLDTVPELVALVEAIRGTLSGDAAALQRHFATTLGGSAAGWSLTLLPLDERVAQQVAQLRIEGRRGEVTAVELRLAGGDRSLMKIEPLAPGSP
jgi:hypothetical protein